MTAEIFPPQRRGQYATLAQSTPLRSPKRTVGNPPPDRSSCCEILWLRRAASPPFALHFAFWCALRVRSPASKYIYMDAFRCETVTRETLLRYTLKSAPVNNLISGNLWKKFSSALREPEPAVCVRGRRAETHDSIGPMASVFSHAVAALGIGACFYQSRAPKRVWVMGALCSILPDL
jgi:hypothetical protein